MVEAEVLNERISPFVTLLWRYETHEQVYSLLTSADGSVIAAMAGRLTEEGQYYLLSSKGELLWRRPMSPGYEKLALSHDGALVIVSHGEAAHLLNKNGDLLWTHEFSYSVRDVSISADGSIIAVGSNKEVYIFGKSGKLEATCHVDGVVDKVRLSTDASVVAISSQKRRGMPNNKKWVPDNNLYLFDKGGSLISKCRNDRPSWVVVSDDASTIVTSSYNNNVYCFDKTGKLLWKYSPSDNRIRNAKTMPSIAVSANGTTVAIGSNSGIIRLFSREGKIAGFCQTAGGTIGLDSVSVSGDGSIIAASGLGTFYLFTRVGEPLGLYKTPSDPNVAMCADGSLIAVGAKDHVYLFRYLTAEAQEKLEIDKRKADIVSMIEKALKET